MRNADSKNELRLKIKLESNREKILETGQSDTLKLHDEGGGKALA